MERWPKLVLRKPCVKSWSKKAMTCMRNWILF